MATINFTTNLPIGNKSPTPWQFNPTNFNGIPDEPGVYIVGVKIRVNDSINHKPKLPVEKFCPLYVGQGKLKSDLERHYYGKRTSSLNGSKELFDIDTDNAIALYKHIQYFEERYAVIRKQKKNVQRTNTECKLYEDLIDLDNRLIWHPNPHFFNYRFQGDVPSLILNNNNGHNFSIKKDLVQPQKQELRNRIIKTKDLIYLKFWHAFAFNGVCPITKQNINANISFNLIKTRNSIEADTKRSLESIRIFTYGDSCKPSNTFQIDLSAIKSDLVNITGNSFS